MIDLLLQIGGILACAGVIVGCICRVDKMGPGKTKFLWWVVYALFGMYALGVLLDLALGHHVDWYESAGIGGLLLEFILTIRSWRDGPPRSVQTQPAPLSEN